ncbi:ABC transporter permease subunit [Pseudoclostridium thermosuccinogenes]|uniref:ABC transporter permease n=1 Tax=Clostridium thermosuccinogenes TaxID=84032 RepID=UPI000CCC8F02|nr:protein lplB [Pseudoclostridium thermosuccinogenes]
MKTQISAFHSPIKTAGKRRSLFREILLNKYIYLLLLPGVAFYIIFSYIPMYGVTLAFKQFIIKKGILGSPWVGFRNFEYILGEPEFWKVFKNTLIISFGRIITGFPVPIIFAILFNELREGAYKKGLQTVYTFPHFLSWVIIAGIVRNLFSNDGAINNLLFLLGAEKYNFLASNNLFRPLLFITDIWKEAGWSSIIYLATIAGISPELYEAASIDGANRFQRIIHITWPELRSTVVLLLILAVGNCMNAGFDQVYNLYNPLVYDSGDIIDTYVFRITFLTNPDFGVSTAVGLFKSFINMFLLIAADRFLKLIGERGIY